MSIVSLGKDWILCELDQLAGLEGMGQIPSNRDTARFLNEASDDTPD